MGLTGIKKYVQSQESLSGQSALRIIQEIEITINDEIRSLSGKVIEAIADYDKNYSSSASTEQTAERRREIQNRVAQVILGDAASVLRDRVPLAR